MPRNPSLCIVCNTPITPANDSREHVIPNSIGGRLKLRGFICAPCNANAGQHWDAELAEQMNPLCLFFGIVRERGVPPSLNIVTTAGEKFTLKSTGGLAHTDPKFSKTQTAQGTVVNASARDMAEARRMLDGLKREFPKFDVDAALAQATETRSYPEGLVRFDFKFGGVLAGRSIVKTAAAFAYYCGIEVGSCDLALAYLRDEAATPCFGYYYETDLVKDRPLEMPFHCVAISADPQTGLLLAYVEFFGAIRMVACLSERYRGRAIDRSYAIDPLSGQTLDLAINLAFTKEDIAAIYAYERVPIEAYRQAFANVFPTGLRRQFDAERNRVLSEAVQYAFAHCGAKEGEMLTQEQKRRLSALVAEKMMPFLSRHMRRPAHGELPS